MNNNKGFTLIELLVAMSIVAVLSILSLPLISSLQQNNADMKYEKYKEAMEVSAKLYADSYEMDLFGYSDDGCGDIPYNTLKDKGLLKELQLEGISCDNSYSYVKVLKSGKNMKFQVSLHCTDENGNDTYKGVIKEAKQICEGTAPVEKEDGTPSCVGSACFTEDESPTLPDITADPEYGSPTSWDQNKNATVKVIVSDADGLINNVGFNYKWVESGQSAASVDYKPENLQNEYGAKEAEKVIKRPEQDGEYKLIIQPTRVMDVLSNTRNKVYEFGPYYFDGNPPVCPNVTANVAAKTWTNQAIQLNIAFASDIEKYDWTPGLNGKWKDKEEGLPRTKNKYDITTEGKNKFKLKVYDVAGNNIECEDMYEEYYYDKTAPSIDLSTQKAIKKNLTIETEDKTSGLAGYAVTTTEQNPTSWTAISGNSFDVTLTKESGKYYVYVKDVAGNINHKSITVQAIPAPSCTISLSGTVGNDSWYKSDVKVTMQVEENPTTYGLSSESSTSTNKKTTVTRESNTKSITYYGYVQNEAGSNTCKKTFKLDQVAPSISVTTKKATKDNMTIKFEDNYSELDAYAVDTSSSTGSKTSWKSISGTSKTVKATGVHGTNYVHVRDNAGNIRTSKAITVKTMDPPSCTVSLSGSKRSNGWYYSDAVTVTLKITGTATTKGLSTDKNSTNGKTSIKRTSDSEGVTYYGYVKNVAGSGTCSANFKKDSTAPTIQKKSNGKIDYIKYKKSGVNIGSRFGYIFLDPTSGFDASEVYGEYCYVGHNSSGCGATCKKGHQWSHNPAKLKSTDKKEYLDIQKTYVPDSHKKDGAEKYRFEAGVSSSCVKGHDVRTYYKACDLAKNCTYTGLHIWEW